jgi:hypothetical protein
MWIGGYKYQHFTEIYQGLRLATSTRLRGFIGGRSTVKYSALNSQNILQNFLLK